MNRINSLAVQRPLVFGLVVTFVFILLVLISSILVGRIWPAETPDWYFGSTISRLVSIFILLFVLSRLEWLTSAGFTSWGGWQTWLILLVPLEYSMVASAYAMTGSLSFLFSTLALTGLATIFIMAHAFLEETAFRGLVMQTFVRLWGNTNRGLITSVLVSSLYFGGMHIIYLAGEPFPVVLLRIVVALLLGILLGALALTGRSIYPAVFFHGLLNVSGYLNLAGHEGGGTSSSWLLLGLFMLPLTLYGLYLLRSQTQPFHNFKSSLQTKNPVR